MVDETGRAADQSGHEHGRGAGRGGDWHDESYIADWLDRQRGRSAERGRQFALVRAFVPRRADEEFRYLNLGAGPGNLDEVLLEHFPGAEATLVDFSMPMLAAARERLARFGHRVEYVHANLERAGWTGAVGGSFDLVVSTLALHHVRDPRRVRALYAEIYGLLGHGGLFLNLDRVRPSRSVFRALAGWAARDDQAGLAGRGHGDDLPGTLVEHLGWLGEAGFAAADVPWKELSSALICGVRDHLHVPEAEAAHEHHDGHDHGDGHVHDHDHDHEHEAPARANG